MNPQSLNRYSYCLNNPLKYIDPSGHDYSYYSYWVGYAASVNYNVNWSSWGGSNYSASGGGGNSRTQIEFESTDDGQCWIHEDNSWKLLDPTPPQPTTSIPRGLIDFGNSVKEKGQEIDTWMAHDTKPEVFINEQAIAMNQEANNRISAFEQSISPLSTNLVPYADIAYGFNMISLGAPSIVTGVTCMATGGGFWAGLGLTSIGVPATYTGYVFVARGITLITGINLPTIPGLRFK
jgi:hypothetical protein